MTVDPPTCEHGVALPTQEQAHDGAAAKKNIARKRMNPLDSSEGKKVAADDSWGEWTSP